MKILAIDPATKCGWAHSNGASGTWDLSIRRDESSGMRLLRFEAKVLEVARLIGIDVIAFESPTVAQGRKANLDGMKLGVKLQAIIERLCEGTDIEHIGYNLSTIKKHATGKGNASKEMMLSAARRRWPDAYIEDDNEADALWLLDIAQKELAADTAGGK